MRAWSPYLDKITEELVEPERLAASQSPFLEFLGPAYAAYRKALVANNRIDFAHLQRFVHDLLQDPEIATHVTSRTKSVLVDEHPDRSGALVRRPLAPGAFAAYGFAASLVRDERSDDPVTVGALVSHVPRPLYVPLSIAGKANEMAWLSDEVVSDVGGSG